jgi:hypothetical protein
VLTPAPEARPGPPPRRQPGAGERRAPRERSPARPPPPARSRRGPHQGWRGRRRRARGSSPLSRPSAESKASTRTMSAPRACRLMARASSNTFAFYPDCAPRVVTSARSARIATRGGASRVITKGQKSRKVFVSDRQILRPLTTNSRSHNTRGSTHSSQSTQPVIGLLESERTVSHG